MIYWAGMLLAASYLPVTVQQARLLTAKSLFAPPPVIVSPDVLLVLSVTKTKFL
jgi:hypothetical protein